MVAGTEVSLRAAGKDKGSKVKSLRVQDLNPKSYVRQNTS